MVRRSAARERTCRWANQVRRSSFFRVRPGVREVRNLHLLAIREHQPGVGQDQLARPAPLAVHLDKALATSPVGGMAAVVVPGDQGHVAGHLGQVGQGVVEAPEGDIPQVPEVVASAQHIRGPTDEASIHLVHVGVRTTAEPDDVLVPVVGVRREVPHGTTMPDQPRPSSWLSSQEASFYRSANTRRRSPGLDQVTQEEVHRFFEATNLSLRLPW